MRRSSLVVLSLFTLFSASIAHAGEIHGIQASALWGALESSGVEGVLTGHQLQAISIHNLSCVLELKADAGTKVTCSLTQEVFPPYDNPERPTTMRPLRVQGEKARKLYDRAMLAGLPIDRASEAATVYVGTKSLDCEFLSAAEDTVNCTFAPKL